MKKSRNAAHGLEVFHECVEIFNGCRAHGQYSFMGTAADVGCGNNLRQIQQRRLHLWLYGKNIQSGSRNFSVLKSKKERCFVDNGAAGSVDNKRRGFYF